MAKRKRRQSKKTTPISNDNLSRYLRDFIPEALEGDDRFLDIITWNIKFFNNRDPKRVDNIKTIMQELNADIFVLQEIEESSLDVVAELLNRSGAGLYKTVYGTTGGDQRVALLYDMDWVKASTAPNELFATENLTVTVNDGSSKEVFPRLPLHSVFVAHREEQPFDFHLVGVHLKSQRGGGSEQRTEAAKRLAQWMTTEVTDEDIIIAGDWNAPPDRPEWELFRALEAQEKVKFLGLNAVDNKTEASHLSVSGRRSRLDLIVVSEAADPALLSSKAEVINWNALLESQNSPSITKEVIDKISDHLPVLTRFYFEDMDSGDEQ
jgi:endonuclease/exonuclease/phosphatase family metal-dependent hydrolase